MNSSLIPWVALIRAIGPATHKKMPMQQLRERCEAAGLSDVRTYIASGNLLFRSGEDAAVIKQRIDDVIAGHGLENAVFLRQPHELAALLSSNPFPQATLDRPNHVLAVFLGRPADEEGLAALDRSAPGLRALPLSAVRCSSTMPRVSASPRSRPPCWSGTSSSPARPAT